MTFTDILEKYRKIAFSERDKGDRFERLMQAYLKTDPLYADTLKTVWMWEEFPFRKDFGGKDTGIDLVALTQESDYWAIQCKCYDENTYLDKPAVDSFLATSSRTFQNDQLQTTRFAHRLWISTTDKWSSNAEETLRNQTPPVTRLTLAKLKEAAVDWEKIGAGTQGNAARGTRKSIRPHQQDAIDKTIAHFTNADRGNLIMACGTGKTFTSLRIAEKLTNGKGTILFLAPSIALIGQTLREWFNDEAEPINAICICSDPKITQKNEETDGYNSIIDLPFPASTKPDTIIHHFYCYRDNPTDGMTVVFSTYQSIGVIAEAQEDLLLHGFPEFDLIICDEAHRTTGITLKDTKDSEFVKVHNNDFIKAKRRLYMTATPRLYSEDAKHKADQYSAELCSMDDEKIYGKEIYRIGFGQAVEQGLLSDYKVLILTLNQSDVPLALQKALTGDKDEITADDTSKLIGCINALSKQIIGDEGSITETDPAMMRRAVAFCPTIKKSKNITEEFIKLRTDYQKTMESAEAAERVTVAARHIDGTMNAPQRDECLAWLKADPADKECHVLTNVRCLSEGVDVPSLDAVLFLSPRNSQIDVVQSVGRVMRRAEGKKYGYIIIPVVIPFNVSAEDALDDNERFKVVWTVLNALRAHDDRFNATVNKLELNKKKPDNIIVAHAKNPFGIGESDGKPHGDTETVASTNAAIAKQLSLQFEELQDVIFGRMVKKVGDRRYLELWAKEVALIAEHQIAEITELVAQPGKHKAAFDEFLAGLQKNINPSITQPEAIEMVAQHIITEPIFEALFEGYSFVKNNPVSISMQTMLDLLKEAGLWRNMDELKKFYADVTTNIGKLDNAAAKQTVIVRLYNNFFKLAFPKMVEKLGIVYTPVEVVDFIIHSVDDVLKKEFGRSLTDENVNILDPFTGTGTFITRLIQSGLIRPEDLARKYEKEIYANEIVLLAYYIAAVNIENAYHDAISNDEYVPFDGICLTDTFQLGETDEGQAVFTEMFKQNSERVERQRKTPLTVIMGNPPYSIGQSSANDNAQNQTYPTLEKHLADTYVKSSKATNSKGVYDSYIKAFRWSTDRLPPSGGVVCFVSNGAWLDGNAMDGFRKCLEKDFSSIYVFNLRGNQRTSGELSKKEGGKIFGSGSRTPIAITLLVKNPDSTAEKAVIYYHDIGDYLKREEKLGIVKKFTSIANIPWTILTPNEHGDWIAQRNDIFSTLIPLAPEKKFDTQSQTFFSTLAIGVATNRDTWSYNFSKQALSSNMQRMIAFYNEQQAAYAMAKQENPNLTIEDFINTDATKISWTVNLKKDVGRNIVYRFDENSTISGIYRPFCKQSLYYDRHFIERPGIWQQLFPTPSHKNLVICLSCVGTTKEISALMADCIHDLHFVGDTQCFPLYYYEENKNVARSMFDDAAEYTRRDGISDFILTRAQAQYGKAVTKEDIFYYVYGFLHSPDYRSKFANDLKKMLPRLPLVDTPKDFWAFSKAGRALADLHLNYETVPPHRDVKVTGAETNQFTVVKMKPQSKDHKDTIYYNDKITVSNIPAAAYQYIVNGKSAIDWLIERYAVTPDKASGITNNPNYWAAEHEKPRYILDLLLSVINVSIQTVDIVAALPKLTFDAEEMV